MRHLLSIYLILTILQFSCSNLINDEKDENGNASFLSEGSKENPVDLGNFPVNYNGQVSSSSNSYYYVNISQYDNYNIELLQMSENSDIYIYSDSGFTNQIGISNNPNLDSESIEIITPGISALFIRIELSGNTGTLFYLSAANNSVYYEGNCIIDSSAELLTISSYTHINGDLTINDSTDITTLGSLTNLNYIQGSLTIENNSVLESINGIGNLRYIGEDYIIHENGILCTNLIEDLQDQVTAFHGIEGTVSISGNLHADFFETLYTEASTSPSWNVSPDELTYTQSLECDPGIYTVPLAALGQTITFDIEVSTTSDDDFIGWIVGYDPAENADTDADWILFDWKQADEIKSTVNGAEGLAMSRVNGQITTHLDLWGHQGVVSEIARAATLGSTGWSDNTTYTIVLNYTTTRIRIWVNAALQFDETGSFPAGNLGFYVYSQQDARFEITSPTDFNDCL